MSSSRVKDRVYRLLRLKAEDAVLSKCDTYQVCTPEEVLVNVNADWLVKEELRLPEVHIRRRLCLHVWCGHVERESLR